MSLSIAITHEEKILESCHNSYPLILDPGRTFAESQEAGVYYADQEKAFRFIIDGIPSTNPNYGIKQVKFENFNYTYNGLGSLQIPGFSSPASSIAWDGGAPTVNFTAGEITFNHDAVISVSGFHGLNDQAASGEDAWTDFHILDQGNGELYRSGRRRPNLDGANGDNSNNINFVQRVQAGNIYKFRVSSGNLVALADGNAYIFVTEV